jgi:hypothetical protein
MEHSATRKSVIAWGTVTVLFALFLVVHYNSLPENYWDPIVVQTSDISADFHQTLEAAKSLHEINKLLFEYQKSATLQPTNETTPFEYLNQVTQSRIDVFKYAGTF